MENNNEQSSSISVNKFYEHLRFPEMESDRLSEDLKEKIEEHKDEFAKIDKLPIGPEKDAKLVGKMRGLLEDEGYKIYKPKTKKKMEMEMVLDYKKPYGASIVYGDTDSIVYKETDLDLYNANHFKSNESHNEKGTVFIDSDLD